MVVKPNTFGPDAQAGPKALGSNMTARPKNP
jgi:hypothetical protein